MFRISLLKVILLLLKMITILFLLYGTAIRLHLSLSVKSLYISKNTRFHAATFSDKCFVSGLNKWVVLNGTSAVPHIKGHFSAIQMKKRKWDNNCFTSQPVLLSLTAWAPSTYALNAYVFIKIGFQFLFWKSASKMVYFLSVSCYNRTLFSSKCRQFIADYRHENNF